MSVALTRAAWKWRYHRAAAGRSAAVVRKVCTSCVARPLRPPWGKLTDDDIDQMQGNAEQLIGKIQSATAVAARKPSASSIPGTSGITARRSAASRHWRRATVGVPLQSFRRQSPRSEEVYSGASRRSTSPSAVRRPNDTSSAVARTCST